MTSISVDPFFEPCSFSTCFFDSFTSKTSLIFPMWVSRYLLRMKREKSSSFFFRMYTFFSFLLLLRLMASVLNNLRFLLYLTKHDVFPIDISFNVCPTCFSCNLTFLLIGFRGEFQFCDSQLQFSTHERHQPVVEHLLVTCLADRRRKSDFVYLQGTVDNAIRQFILLLLGRKNQAVTLNQNISS